MGESILEQFKLVHALIRSLSSSELSVLKGFLTAFESRKKGFKPKGLILTELIMKHDDPKKALDLFRKKLGKDSLKTASVSIQRLRDKVYDTFVLDVNLKREGVLTESASDFSELIKKRVQIGMLTLKGQRELAGQLFRSAINQAQKAEKYADLIELLIQYRQRFGNPSQLKEHKKLTEKIHFYQKCLTAVYRSKDIKEDLHINFRSKGLNTTDPDGSYRSAVENAVGVLKKDFDETGSAVIGLEYYTLSSELAQIDLNFTEATTQFKLMLDLLANNSSVRSRIRTMVTNLNIAQNYIYQLKFNDAMPYVQASKAFTKKRTTPHLTILGQEFYINLFSGELEKAAKISEELITDSVELKHEPLIAKHSYYAAACAFCAGLFKSANRFLLDTDLLLKDKQGYNVALRVLKILLAIEGEKFDLADSQIINLRQFIRDGLKEVATSKRDNLILSVLLDLRKNSYNFEQTRSELSEEIDSLYSKDAALAWLPESAEVICFHLWFDAKTNGDRYNPELSPERVYTKPVYNI